MHTRLGPLALLAASAVLLAGCSTAEDAPASSAASSPVDSAPTSASAEALTCLPVPGDSLVVLTDDLTLQNSDNVIPAVNVETATDAALLAALDAVSDALDTNALIQLNKAVDIDRKTSAEVAEAFVADAGITAPLPGGGDLTVGAANFSENITVAEIYGVVLRDAGYDVTVRAIGNRETYLPALQSGEIDIVPEYAATVAEYLNRSLNGADAPPVASGDIKETYVALSALGNESGIIFGKASAAQDQNAFAVTTAFAEEYGVTSLSELAEVCGGGISLGGPPECPERTFCQLGLEDAYGIKVTDFSALDAGGPLTKTAIRQGAIAVGLVFSSDGELAQ